MPDTEPIVTPAAVFAVYVEEYGGSWESAIGRRIRHRDLGWGTIVALERRDPMPSLLTLRFDADTSARRFQSTTLRDFTIFPEFDLSGIPGVNAIHREITERLQTERRRLEEKRRLAQQKEDQRTRQQREREHLKRTYAPNIHPDNLYPVQQERLYGILRAIDANEPIPDDGLYLLNQWGCRVAMAAAEAEDHEREFRRTHDEWKLVLASSAWRRARQPRRALESTTDIDLSSVNSQRLRAAIFTTRGGSHRDLGSPAMAEKCVQDALSCDPASYRAYRLWGVLLMQAGKPEDAERCLEMARELGAPDSQDRLDREIRRSLDLADPDARRVSARYLLGKDESRYRWVNQYLAS